MVELESWLVCIVEWLVCLMVGLGLLVYPWWTGDILHFYGGYMHLAAFFLLAVNADRAAL